MYLSFKKISSAQKRVPPGAQQSGDPGTARGESEHESIVFVAARPMHVHTALLLLGVKNGNPAIRQQIGKENPRWVDLPPRGDPINVFFVVQNADQRSVERPVSDFVVLCK